MYIKTKNYFSYLKSQPDYHITYTVVKNLFSPFFNQNNDYKLVENTLIDLIIPAVYYFEDERIEGNLSIVVYVIENDFDILIESDKKLKEAKCKMLAKDIIAVRNQYKYLTYYNQNGFQPLYLTNFMELVYKFLKVTDIWEIKSYKDDPNGYFWQTEWDIEYKQILNIAYFANSLEEVNDIYKLVWMIWLCDIYKPDIHKNAKIIWKNIDYWRKLINENIYLKQSK